MRVRRAADEWGNYNVPIEQRKYTPFSGRGEPTTLPDLHGKVGNCYKAIDYQLFDRNYIRWVRGDDVADLGKKPEKKFPSLSRIYSEKFHKARAAEGLASQRETVEFLLAEYENWPPGFTYSDLRLEYPVHLARLDAEVHDGTKTPTGWMREAFPNRYLARQGVRNPVGLRRVWGLHAAHKLAPFDHAYVTGLREVLVERGRQLGLEREARDLARAATPKLLDLCTTASAVDFSLTTLFREPEVYRRSRLNGQLAPAVESLDKRAVV